MGVFLLFFAKKQQAVFRDGNPPWITRLMRMRTASPFPSTCLLNDGSNRKNNFQLPRRSF